jgi:hypothetical protein
VGLQQFAPVSAGLALRAAQSLSRQPGELVRLEEVEVAALERLAHVFREVKYRQILADETAHPD